MKSRLDGIDRSLVNLLQSGFPLVPQPYAEIGSKLGLTEAEVLRRVVRLREDRIVRILGPVFNSRALGYRSTLVAMRVPSERVEGATEIINAHPGVGHDYLRDHYYNLWFTLAVRSERDLADTLQVFENQIQPEAMLELPALRLFKIRLFFDLEGNGGGSEESAGETLHATSLPLTPVERAVTNEVQQQLPAASRPFEEMAGRVGMRTEEFLACCRSLLERGIMRRFGASIEHRNAGFVANAMVCWAVPPSAVEEIGFKMAAFKEVTHCYERRTGPLWPRYNVFSMIHGKTPEENSATVARIVEATGIRDYEVLPTLLEFKKERVRYRV
ncbi:MAG: Lrp/AsnC family transcriptional regulator [Chloroflexi bacterium]|nr:Lrp/AsnC family transcriptional regulator [Chloroflexota bacterium]